MSIPLTSIDCPYLTNECLRHLIEQYSIHTTNDFVLWSIKSPDKINRLSSQAIECIHSCLIAHTAQLQYRVVSKPQSYKLNHLLFDHADLFASNRHLIFIYEYFNQNQWNTFFNIFLLRLFLANDSLKIQYFNTNVSLFDLKYFYQHYCCLNEQISHRRDHVFEQCFYFHQCLDLETFEKQLTSIETNENSIQILIIDDFLSLIKPYLSLDRRIKGKVLQLTYRLNCLAQKQSILIINGLIFNSKKRMRNVEEKVSLWDDVRFDSFHADKYVLFQSLTALEKDIYISMMNREKQASRSRLDLDEWKDGKFSLEDLSKSVLNNQGKEFAFAMWCAIGSSENRIYSIIQY